MSLHRITPNRGNLLVLVPPLTGIDYFVVMHRDGNLISMEGYHKEEKTRYSFLFLLVGNNLVSPIMRENKTKGGLAAINRIGKVMAIANGRTDDDSKNAKSVANGLRMHQLETLSISGE